MDFRDNKRIGSGLRRKMAGSEDGARSASQNENEAKTAHDWPP
jgi:hypothetical protein